MLAVFRHPAPYRDPLMDRLAAIPWLDLEVAYLAQGFAATPWDREPLAHSHSFPRPLLGFVAGGQDVALHPSALALLRPRPRAVVLSGWADPTVLALMAACRTVSIPYVLVAESWYPTGLVGLPPGLATRVRQWAVSGASAWLPTGSRAKAYMASLGADPARSHFFPTSPDARRWSAFVDGIRKADPSLRGSLGLPADGVIAFVGRIVADKAPDVLLDAMGHLLQARPGARLVMVGDGPLRERLMAHEAAGAVHFPGFLQPREVARILAASDVFALPSRYETWGAVATEALAAGLPVVLSEAVGCAPDLLAGEDPPGIEVPAGDAAALASALDLLLGVPPPRLELAARARKRGLEWGHDLNARSFVRALADAGVSEAQGSVEGSC